MDDIILKIRESYARMSKSERALSDFILEHTVDILSMTANEIAAASGVSSATVIRYVKKLDVSGLDAFKLALAALQQQRNTNEWKMSDSIISAGDTLQDIATKMKNRSETAMNDFFYQIDYEALEQAVEKLQTARHIYTVGLGASYMPAYDLFHKLRRAGFDANCYTDINMMVEFLNYFSEQDVIVAFSYSGQSKEVIYACNQAKKHMATVIAVTRNDTSPILDVADIVLRIPANEDVQRIGAFQSLETSLMMEWLLYLGAIQSNFEQIEVDLIKTRKMIEDLKQTR